MSTETGTLYIVATPIGNLGDITLRALEILKTADIVAAEDTRQTGKLLAHFDIKKPLISYFEHNKAQRGPKIIEMLKEGSTVALVSDAGTPGISDPGADIIRLARAEGIAVTMAPGPAAGIMAVVLSGLDTSSFLFQGFLPEEKRKRHEILKELKGQPRTVIFYESPHRIKDTIGEICDIIGPDRRLALCREMTKIHEEVVLLPAEEHLNGFGEKPPRGEYVIVMEGRSPEDAKAELHARWAAVSVAEQIDGYIKEGLSRKEAMRRAGEERGMGRNEIYAAYEAEKKSR